jgi:micrococcal nuclease
LNGDTIWYRCAKIRIADIDTPESAAPRCEREAELGRKATERLQSLLNEAPFRFEPAPVGRQQDRFGRELKFVERGDTSIGSVLVREGLAQRWGSSRRGWC